MAYYSRLASAIYNDVYSGLQGFHENLSMSLELLEDEIVTQRLAVILELILKNALPKSDLLLTLNCINVDCKDLAACPCGNSIDSQPTAHFEIPQTVSDFGTAGLSFVGSADKTVTYTVYTSMVSASIHPYRRRRAKLPYVYINTTPNENNMYDCFIFNAPFIKQVSVIGLFKDLRQVEQFGCCRDLSENYSYIDLEVQKRLTETKIRYYRQLASIASPNDLKYK